MRISAVDWTHEFLKNHIHTGDICIDATVGNGGDTLFLSELVGETGTVLGFDIQDIAVKKTTEKLKQHGRTASIYQDSHVNMGNYVKKDSVQAIVFNLGYLPGGDHTLATRAESTIRAVETGLTLLKKGGVMSLCIYSGGDSGFEERDEVLAYMKTLDPKKYLVVVNSFFNMPNHPPIPVFVIKL